MENDEDRTLAEEMGRAALIAAASVVGAVAMQVGVIYAMGKYAEWSKKRNEKNEE